MARTETGTDEPYSHLMMDRRRFSVAARQWEELQTALDAPARVSPRLQKLLQEPSVFERPAG